jgi:hypothetical protein
MQQRIPPRSFVRMSFLHEILDHVGASPPGGAILISQLIRAVTTMSTN